MFGKDLYFLASVMEDWKPPHYFTDPNDVLVFVDRYDHPQFCEEGSTNHKRYNCFTKEQWQDERLKIEAERMDIIARNGNDGDHYD